MCSQHAGRAHRPLASSPNIRIRPPSAGLKRRSSRSDMMPIVGRFCATANWALFQPATYALLMLPSVDLMAAGGSSWGALGEWHGTCHLAGLFQGSCLLLAYKVSQLPSLNRFNCFCSTPKCTCSS